MPPDHPAPAPPPPTFADHAPPEALARLHAAAFTRPRPWSAAEFAALCASPGTRLLAAAEGFALLRVTAGEAELLTLAVAPAARRRGLGARLLAAALTAAGDAGADEIFLEVAADNAAARALYADAGFAAVGQRPAYFDGTDAVVMRRALTDPPPP